MENRFRAFLDEIVPTIEKLTTYSNECYWKMTTSVSKETEQEFSKSREALLKLYSSKESFAKLKEFKESDQIQDALLSRQLTILYNQFVTNQISEENIRELVRLETEIEGIFAKFRAEYKGRRISDNEINSILSDELDSSNRKEAWEASKKVGEEVAPILLELVRLRNKTARELGYSDYYSMSLEVQEINEEELFGILDRLKALTDKPFARIKKELDKKLSAKFGIQPEDMRPWHYSDRFFQEVPNTGDIDWDSMFKGKDIVAMARNYYASIGLKVDDILKRSDLYERENKNQHAYCIDIDKGNDVRILCNIKDTEDWMSTTLHELGHAVYDQHIDMSLPYLLRDPAHTFTTEAVAMLFGRLVQNPDWLQAIAEIDAEKAEALRAKIEKELMVSQLVFVRWALVMVYFEKQLYKGNVGNPNRLWWDLVEELQFVKRPENRDAQDWATKIHLGTAPVYYHNYILGELTASQLQSYISKSVGNRSMVGNTALGKYLIDNIFEPANRFTWNEMLTLATGEPLNPEHFVKQFVK